MSDARREVGSEPCPSADGSAHAENPATSVIANPRRLKSFDWCIRCLASLNVTFKIETASDRDGTVIRLIGWLRAECLPEVEAKIGSSSRPVVLEMAEVMLVDVEAVRFLGVCETQGIELRHCPSYIREWIARERARKV